MRGKGTKLGEGNPKVRLSQDRMAIEPLAHSHFLPSPSYMRGKGTNRGKGTKLGEGERD